MNIVALTADIILTVVAVISVYFLSGDAADDYFSGKIDSSTLIVLLAFVMILGIFCLAIIWL